MKGASLFLLFCLAAGLAAGQPGATYSPRYYSFISRGRELRTARDYIGSGRMFDSGFQSAGWQGRPRDFYDAGCSWALAGVVDQAYIDLYRAVRQGKYAHPEEAEKDSDLVALRADKRWPDIIGRMRVNKMAASRKFDVALRDTLDRIF